jgi:hypothetical protein
LNRLTNSKTCNIIERELFEEIKNYTFYGIEGFYDKFFNTKSWRKEQKEALEALIAEHDGKM